MYAIHACMLCMHVCYACMYAMNICMYVWMLIYMSVYFIACIYAMLCKYASYASKRYNALHVCVLCMHPSMHHVCHVCMNAYILALECMIYTNLQQNIRFVISTRPHT